MRRKRCEHSPRTGRSTSWSTPTCGQLRGQIFLDDLDARVATIAGRGLEPDDIEIYSNGVRKAIYRDPDGNELSFGRPPLDAGSSA